RGCGRRARSPGPRLKQVAPWGREPMDGYILALHAAVLAAALFQAATGIGFGILAGPIILMVMNSGSAVQVTILLSLLIAVVLAPTLYRRADKNLLRRLLAGTLAGLPIGIVVFVQVSVDLLKLLAGLAVLFMALSATGLLRQEPLSGKARGARVKDYGIGVLSGAMSASLAMPGPVAAAHMSSLAYAKDTIRATILVMFVFSYSAAIAFQAVLVGVSGETLSLAATLVPATLIGILLGRISVGWIGERGFRRLISIVLFATSISLLVVSFKALFGNA
ncbi:MAG: sulfite exporter TauE/SafE family protein, partial [Alphaproteobacteria bacterium]|nr:sulfite exporter TauE/SafE family protein [Alphaproteobacteria bacterium]